MSAAKRSLREGREVAVLGLELDELREEGERLVGGAHGDGAGDGGDDGKEPEEDVSDGLCAVARASEGLALASGGWPSMAAAGRRDRSIAAWGGRRRRPRTDECFDRAQMSTEMSNTRIQIRKGRKYI